VQLGDPLSGSYLSAIEAGKVVPSLPALLFMLERLGVSAPIFFEAVNCRLRSL
jgi:transcriptional regulator with XRE-family HTH domain